MVFRASVAPRVERELFPRTRHDTERSPLHDQAILAMRTCASMKQMDRMVDTMEEATRAEGTTATRGTPERAPGTLEGQRRRRRDVDDDEEERRICTRTGTQGSKQQTPALPRGSRRAASTAICETRSADDAEGCVGANGDFGGERQQRDGALPSSLREELLQVVEGELGARGLTRPREAALIADAAAHAAEPVQELLSSSVQGHRVAFSGWVQGEADVARELMAIAAMVPAGLTTAAARSRTPRSGACALEATLLSLAQAMQSIFQALQDAAVQHAEQASAVAAAAAHSTAVAEDAARTVAHAVGSMAALNEARACSGSPGAHAPGSEVDGASDGEPQWLRDAAVAAGVGGCAPEGCVSMPTRASERGARTATQLQCMWRCRAARRALCTRREAAAATAADVAREERRRAARERLALREAEERARREAKAARRRAKRRAALPQRDSAAAEQRAGDAEAACLRATHQHAGAAYIFRFARAVEQLQGAWRRRRERRFRAAVRLQAVWRRLLAMRISVLERAQRNAGRRARGTPQRAAEVAPAAPGPFIVPAAPGQKRLVSLVLRAEAALRVQAAWRGCSGRRAVRSAHWARMVAGADADIARRCATREAQTTVGTAVLQRRVATVRAFRQLEAELRAQGIRAASGAASGGRQRARLREQRRREQIAERIWQGTFGAQ